jgi:ADP-L-glycero-D-manno-heptose 6-epimerase
MILVTGGAGFIGSALIHELNSRGAEDIIIVDDLGVDQKWKNLRGLKFIDCIGIEEFTVSNVLEDEAEHFDVIFHLGACSATTETDVDFLLSNNTGFSKNLFSIAAAHDIPFFYASSAATYGAGELGYDDNEELLGTLRPLNPYGYSKQLFDEWVLKTKMRPTQWAGFKFFNVFGPNEYHKGSMKSVVHHAFEQINSTGKMKLFKSEHPDYEDGLQVRDFVYVKDVTRAMVSFWDSSVQGAEINGIYNLGTGKARTFKDLVEATFHALEKPVKIEYIDMPESLKDQYQYYTQAEMKKFHAAIVDFKFTTLEQAVSDYVKNHLVKATPYLEH